MALRTNEHESSKKRKRHFEMSRHHECEDKLFLDAYHQVMEEIFSDFHPIVIEESKMSHESFKMTLSLEKTRHQNESIKIEDTTPIKNDAAEIKEFIKDEMKGFLEGMNEKIERLHEELNNLQQILINKERKEDELKNILDAILYRLNKEEFKNPEIFYQLDDENGEAEVIVLVDPIEDVDERIEIREKFWKVVSDLTTTTTIPFVLLFYPRNAFGGNLDHYSKYNP